MSDMPYRSNAEPLPQPTPVPWRCRWFGHTFGTIIPVMPGPRDGKPLRLIQKCGRRSCEKWTRVDLDSRYIGDDVEWRELHELLPDD